MARSTAPSFQINKLFGYLFLAANMLLKSIGSMSVLNVVKAVVVFLTSAIVAKAVAPADFALVSFALPLMVFLILITDLGIAAAVVRQPQLSKCDAGAALFVLSLAAASSAMLLVSLSAYLEASFKLPGLSVVLVGFALTTGASIIAVVPRALLERSMDYTRVAAIEFAALASGVIAFALLLVWSDGIKALLSFHLVSQMVRAGVFLMAARHEMSPCRNIRPALKMMTFGLWTLGANLISFLARNIDRFILVRILGAPALGLYGLSYQFMTVPLMVLAWPASGVLLSALSRSQGDAMRQKVLIGSVSAITGILAFSFMAASIILLDFPLRTLYGARWSGLSELVAILAPAGAIQSLAVYAGASFVAAGRMRTNIAFAVAHAVNTMAVFMLGSPFGLNAVVMAYTVGSSVVSIGMLVAMCKVLGWGARDYMSLIAPGLFIVLASSPLMICVWGVGVDSMVAWLACFGAFLLLVGIGFFVARESIFSQVRLLRGMKVGGASGA
jgi:O-antigen/teichoic acid export membrane protein